MRFIRNLGILPLLTFVLGITMIGGGCGKNHAIMVTFSPALPTTLVAGATAQLTALAANDFANKGVTWSCMPTGACGSFNPAATASGTATTYTAPAAVPAGGSVTIIATSVTDTTKMATGMITITGAPAIAVTFSVAPPASINTSAVASITATVANDSMNKGVTWTCAPTNACGPGSFSPSATASGTATMFTAPASTSTGSLLIITATSVSDPTKFATASVALAVTAQLSVVITQFPAQQSVQTGASVALGATVSNDASNQGVKWTCSSANTTSCGAFAPTQTASGATTMYTAPATLPQSPQVTLTATSVADNTQSASITFTITPAGTQNSRLNGHYTFNLNGQVLSSNLPSVGSVVLDGNGNVTSGEFDQPGEGSNNFTAIPVTGTYSVGADGRGTMTLSFSVEGIPGNELALDFALTSNSHGVLVETDGLISASGSLDQQSAGPFTLSQLTGGYSFAFSGIDIAAQTAVVAGGIVTADGAGNLTNGTFDLNDAGALSSNPFTGSVTAPDAFGRGTFTTSNGGAFAYYIVTPKVLRVVETDSNFTTGGSIYSQGSAASFTDASLTGSFVFGALGQSPNAGTAFAGQFTTDAGGNITAGIADSVTAEGATVSTLALSGSTYSIPSSPRGSLSLTGGPVFRIYLTDPSLNLLDPNNATGGGGALLIENDATGFTIGELIPQTTGAALTGSYAVNLEALQNQGLGVDFQLDLSGQATASGGNSYSGLADYAGTAFNGANTMSLLEPVVNGSSIAGTLTPDASNAGHFTGTLTITPPTGTTYFLPQPAANATLGLSYYQASGTKVFFIQTDKGEVALGVLEQ